MEKLFRIISKKYKLINNKVFCVGANKTGTTSIGEFLKETGYRVAPQIPAERFINTWAIRDFRLLFQFCRKYEAFQDIPFSLDYTFQFLDFNFPNSKFILTIRSSAEEWLESYRRFTRKLIGPDKIINRENLSKINYNYPGFFIDSLDLIYGKNTPLFDEKIYTENYLHHNYSIETYFKYRRNQLLIINLSEPCASEKLCSFLNIKPCIKIPHTNSSIK